MQKRINALLSPLCLCLILSSSPSFANQIVRTYQSESSELKKYDLNTQYQLDITVAEAPIIESDQRKKNSAWLFKYSIENRYGLEVKAKRLSVGDIILDPLKTISGVEILRSGSKITEADLLYLRENAYRTMYDASGTPLGPNSFKVGDNLNVFKRTFDSENQLSYDESGFQTTEGKIIIENGTTLEKHHLEILKQTPILPVRIRHPLNLNLKAYLRVNWPDQVLKSSKRYWVKRNNITQPLYLLGYQIQEGDIPLGNIVLTNKTIICQKGVALQKSGAKNSIEILDQHPNATMLSDHKKVITSIDPISLSINDNSPEPGELVFASQNNVEFSRPFLIRNENDLQSLFKKGNYSFSFSYNHPANSSFPYYIYLTRYPIPFHIDCFEACDKLLDISNDVMSGSHQCKSCKKQVSFPPYVYEPISAYGQREKLWEQHPIDCHFCDESFLKRDSHALAGPIDDGNEYESISPNFVIASHLRLKRLPRDSKLAKDIHYYMNGEEITIDQSSPIDEDLRRMLEQRATTPIYLRPPTKQKVRAAQCPKCFTWNTIPLFQHELNETLIGVDETRNGVFSFKHLSQKVNKLELVIFGLNSDIEPTSGRKKAFVATYRRYGDENFQLLSRWRLDKTKWSYLPLYGAEPTNRPPRPVKSISESSSEPGDDLLEF